ncbi:hypothetical protein BHE74_00014541 [Ensete ventricosum]|uniref:Auxin-responsive protein n=1 Tax=Ensete ventricosum TaxID=4639 RepID=A0A426YW50_ENSVE|nr:hypothetical protein B296_00023701 [Ensete ventricosum]RWV90238.1 hypothetical protein GW17_00047578 [Ensete ventricosum]RWW77307.1 hypothetical protein BHE74_00014541 [Ensete ventricosum]RZR93624.1 hypothetical protein BHM03_00022186 [Ensete ventricosum]
MTPPLEHDYLGLSESPGELSGNLKDTELRLGLPGSESPERVDGGGAGLTLGLPKSFVSGAKRGFSDAIDGPDEWGLPGVNGSDGEQGTGGEKANGNLLGPPSVGKDDGGAAKVAPSPNFVRRFEYVNAGVEHKCMTRMHSQNTMAANPSKNKEDAKGKHGLECLYIKVSMDGAPYLRKVDLKTYSNYKDLSLALEKMFTCFTIGQCGSYGMTEGSRVVDLLQGSEYVLTYEDKDGDWMLVGDVPWE